MSLFLVVFFMQSSSADFLQHDGLAIEMNGTGRLTNVEIYTDWNERVCYIPGQWSSGNVPSMIESATKWDLWLLDVCTSFCNLLGTAGGISSQFSTCLHRNPCTSAPIQPLQSISVLCDKVWAAQYRNNLHKHNCRSKQLLKGFYFFPLRLCKQMNCRCCETVLEVSSLACLTPGWKASNDRSVQSSCLWLFGAPFAHGYTLVSLGSSLSWYLLQVAKLVPWLSFTGRLEQQKECLRYWVMEEEGLVMPTLLWRGLVGTGAEQGCMSHFLEGNLSCEDLLLSREVFLLGVFSRAGKISFSEFSFRHQMTGKCPMRNEVHMNEWVNSAGRIPNSSSEQWMML